MATITIPLILADLQGEGFHLLVEVFVFGARHYAVVDTGASRSVFDKERLSQHLSPHYIVNDLQANTLFSTTETYQATIPELKIGSIRFENYLAMAIDLSSVTETYQQMGLPPILAILGGDILVRCRARINYERQTLRISTPVLPFS